MPKVGRYIFHGNPDKAAKKRHPDAPTEPEPYVALPELTRAVNLAIYLRRPLLVEGEAGCGKTRLARAVAYELGLPFYPWYVHSTSKAKEGLYEYDAILRLHDVQVPASALPRETQQGKTAKVLRDPKNPKDYRSLGPLGKAFYLTRCSAVVLIDEIDKADIDFPNDLLSVLDDPWAFKIPETGELISASAAYKPIVIITSNKEKGNLPAPFLRRCIYYYLEFPDPKRLKEIVKIHYDVKQAGSPGTKLVTKAIKQFSDLRTEGSLHKNPGTSEFLDWLKALHGFKSPAVKKQVVLKDDGTIPYPELLFKLRADWQRYAADDS